MSKKNYMGFVDDSFRPTRTALGLLGAKTAGPLWKKGKGEKKKTMAEAAEVCGGEGLVFIGGSKKAFVMHKGVFQKLHCFSEDRIVIEVWGEK